MRFKFNPGDLVKVHQVASNKIPVMTVVGQAYDHPIFNIQIDIDTSNEQKWYLCRWFWEGEFKTNGFREEELELVLAHII